MPVLFGLTVFLSAALLFVLEPMFARMVLPKLGGSPAVWNTTMVFYQAALLAGYGYAHVSSRWLAPRRQRWLQLGILLVPLLALPVRVPGGWSPPTAENPLPWLLALLTVAVGLPFFAVSTSGPLLQRWYATTGGRSAADPYFLYAASNLGSLLGLLAYPLLIEPRLRLGQQSQSWTWGYLLLVLLTAACAVFVGRAPTVAPAGGRERPGGAGADPLAARTSLTWTRRLRWLALAFVPSSLMLGVTQHLSMEVASIPLLWVIPLSIYLASFVLVFSRGSTRAWRWATRALPFAVLVVIITLLYAPDRPLLLVMGIHLVGLLIMATACHGALAHDRPGVEHLTGFYLWMALGGALGGVFNAIVAPAVFSTVAEYPLAVALAAMVAPALRPEPETRRARLLDYAIPLFLAALCMTMVFVTRSVSEYRQLADTRLMPVLLMLTLLRFTGRPLRFGLGVLLVFTIGHIEPGQGSRLLYRERTFFGVHRVVAETGRSLHTLFHGTIVHGVQSVLAERRGEPLSYFHRGGPVGQVFAEIDSSASARTVGVVGLGAGTLAAYAKPADHWTIYEIDPTVERIARNPALFTYLVDCPARLDILLGDARLSLSRATEPRFDILVLDAYSSDAVPVHLLTREAVAVYRSRLAPHGVMAFHISSRHFRLARVVAGLADDAGLVCRMRDDPPLSDDETERGLASSTWVVVARTLGDLIPLTLDRRWREIHRKAGLRVWTDDYSSVLPVIAWR